ncbi:MAG: hypothetical protein LUI02_04090, partial [Clostridiales bacterium]|nr:hypothetical protein [Clostridiales bacterium]
TKQFTSENLNITAINSKTSKQGVATIDVSFLTGGRDEIIRIIEKVKQVDSVLDIERTMG